MLSWGVHEKSFITSISLISLRVFESSPGAWCDIFHAVKESVCEIAQIDLRLRLAQLH